MSTALLDECKYQELLDDRMLEAVSGLMGKAEPEITNEEGRLLDLLSMLIEEYGDRVHPLPPTTPHKMLAYLLEVKGMKQSDLWPLLPKSRVSEILAGKRGISKEQAKKLAALFRVPVDLFL